MKIQLFKKVISKYISIADFLPLFLFLFLLLCVISTHREGTVERKLFGCDIISNNSFSRHVIRMLFNEIEHNDDVGEAVATTLTFFAHSVSKSSISIAHVCTYGHVYTFNCVETEDRRWFKGVKRYLRERSISGEISEKGQSEFMLSVRSIKNIVNVNKK